jgi:hypothetical protein
VFNNTLYNLEQALDRYQKSLERVLEEESRGQILTEYRKELEYRIECLEEEIYQEELNGR